MAAPMPNRFQKLARMYTTPKRRVQASIYKQGEVGWLADSCVVGHQRIRRAGGVNCPRVRDSLVSNSRRYKFDEFVVAAARRSRKNRSRAAAVFLSRGGASANAFAGKPRLPATRARVFLSAEARYEYLVLGGKLDSSSGVRRWGALYFGDVGGWLGFEPTRRQ